MPEARIMGGQVVKEKVIRISRSPSLAEKSRSPINLIMFFSSGALSLATLLGDELVWLLLSGLLQIIICSRHYPLHIDIQRVIFEGRMV